MSPSDRSTKRARREQVRIINKLFDKLELYDWEEKLKHCCYADDIWKIINCKPLKFAAEELFCNYYHCAVWFRKNFNSDTSEFERFFNELSNNGDYKVFEYICIHWAFNSMGHVFKVWKQRGGKWIIRSFNNDFDDNFIDGRLPPHVFY